MGRIERYKRKTRGYRVYCHGFAHARGSSCTCPCTPVSLTEDIVSVDANASQLGSRPKALSGIEFHQTSFNQQVLRLELLSLSSSLLAKVKTDTDGGWAGSANGMEWWHGAYDMPSYHSPLGDKYTQE